MVRSGHWPAAAHPDDAEKTDSDAASQTPATDPSPTSTDGTASGASASPGWYPDPGDSERPLVLGWFRMDFAEPVADSVAGKSGGLTGARGTPDAKPNGVTESEPTPRHQEMDHRRGSGAVSFSGRCGGFWSDSVVSQWRGLDPRHCSILDKDAGRRLRRSLQINARFLQGFGHRWGGGRACRVPPFNGLSTASVAYRFRRMIRDLGVIG